MTPWSVRSLPTVPDAPRLLGPTPVAADALQLTWTVNISDVIAGYRIERSGSAGGPFAPVARLGGQSRSYLDPGLQPDTPYFYRVVAFNAAGESGPSNVDGATTRRRTLAPPLNVQASSNLSGTIKVGWTGGTGSETAVIEFLQDGVQGVHPLDQTRNAGAYYHAFNEQTAYSYRVKFVSGNDESAWQEAVFGVNTAAVPIPRLYLPAVRR
jgi:hypothetical protein